MPLEYSEPSYAWAKGDYHGEIPSRVEVRLNQQASVAHARGAFLYFVE